MIMKEMMSSKEAANYLGYPETSLRSARSRGVLAGVKPPRCIKRGGRIFFKKTTLDTWLSQFEES